MGFKRVFIAAILLAVFSLPAAARGSWTEKQARAWEKRTGIIKGINGVTNPAWRGEDEDAMFERLHQLGFNSIRCWITDKTPEKQTEHIRKLLDKAEKHSLTLSPVLRWQSLGSDFEASAKGLQKVVAALRKDKRIVIWDIWNEPSARGRLKQAQCIEELERVEKLARMCMDANPCQPITASIFWDISEKTDYSSPVLAKMSEVEAVMDIHNYHDYVCTKLGGKVSRDLVDHLNIVSDRPLVCTECMQRTNGSGVGASLAVFAEKKVHFYVWGGYLSNANWGVAWKRSEFEPWDIPFHDMMWNDGDPIDAREIEMIRNFRWTAPGEQSVIPPIEERDRWSAARAWQRCAVWGPVKGLSSAATEFDKSGIPEGFNSLRVSLSAREWLQDKTVADALGSLLDKAADAGISVLPVLSDDGDLDVAESDMIAYLDAILGRFYDHRAVFAWDIYYHPGEQCADASKVNQRLRFLFAGARAFYTNQPLTATPAVSVKDFPSDFNPRAALVHGKRDGWQRLKHSSGSNEELLFTIWSLSDVLSFSSDMDADRNAWLTAMCRRFGRPILCTLSGQPDEATLKGFAGSHVYWWTNAEVAPELLAGFRFIPIQTPHPHITPEP